MDAELELAEAKARIADLEGRENERTKAGIVAREIAKHDLVSPAAAEQLQDLLMPTLGMTTSSDGRAMIFGKDYLPLETVVGQALEQSPHFLKQGAGAPAAAQAAAPVRPSGTPTGATPSTLREILPGETFGAAVIRVATAQQTAKGDPRLDPSQPMGLGRHVFPR